MRTKTSTRTTTDGPDLSALLDERFPGRRSPVDLRSERFGDLRTLVAERRLTPAQKARYGSDTLPLTPVVQPTPG